MTTKLMFGDCESCTKSVNVNLTELHGMMMCDACIALEQEATKRTQEAAKVIETARRQDTQIELKQDIFNAATTSFAELHSAVTHNQEIPADKKDAAIMAELAARIDRLSAVIFAEKAETAKKETERHALLVNAQQFAAKLTAAEQEKWKQYSVNYKPQTPKNIKPQAPRTPKVSSTPTKAFSKKELYAAAEKYGVPAIQVQGIAAAMNLTAEQAALHLAKLLGKV